MLDKHFILLFALIMTLSASAQQKQLAPVSIGRAVPKVQIYNVQNHSQTSFNISDFKDKLIIFDFWDVNCTPYRI